MSGDYMAQLLALATGRAAVVEPRGKQRFEPEIGLVDPFAAGITEEAPAVSPRAVNPPIAPVPPGAPPAMLADLLPAYREPVTRAPQEHAAPASILAAAPATLAAADVPPATQVRWEQQPAAPPVGTAPEAATMAIPQETARLEARQPAPQSSTIHPGAVLRTAMPLEARPGPSPLNPGRRIGAHPVPATPAAPATEPPAITIRIDRIDIHAPAPPVPPRPAAAPSVAAPTDLAAYLAHRREGGW